MSLVTMGKIVVWHMKDYRSRTVQTPTSSLTELDIDFSGLLSWIVEDLLELELRPRISAIESALAECVKSIQTQGLKECRVKTEYGYNVWAHKLEDKTVLMLMFDNYGILKQVMSAQLEHLES